MTLRTRILVVGFLLMLLLAAPVAAQTETPNGGEATQGEDDDGGDTIVNIDLEEVVEAIENLIDEFQDFTGDWDKTLESVLIAVLFHPFRTLLAVLISSLAKVLTTTPQVYPNPVVEEIHREALLVTYLLSTVAFMVAGLLYIVGPILGVSYRQARKILPRLITALIFASISLPILQLAVDLTNALSTAFAPQYLTYSYQQMAGLGASVVLAWVINSVLLLAVVALFLLRGVYILFGAAISPLLALMWSLPKLKRYADTFIAGWFAALLMAPLDLLVLRFGFALMNGAGNTALQSISNWIFGVASFTLLLLVPYQLWGASQTAVGQAYAAADTVKQQYNTSNTEVNQYNELQERSTGTGRSNKFSEEMSAFKDD